MAVSYLGLTVQARLEERDEDGKAVNDIYKALHIKKPIKNPPRSIWQGIQGVKVED